MLSHLSQTAPMALNKKKPTNEILDIALWDYTSLKAISLFIF